MNLGVRASVGGCVRHCDCSENIELALAEPSACDPIDREHVRMFDLNPSALSSSTTTRATTHSGAYFPDLGSDTLQLSTPRHVFVELVTRILSQA